MFLLIEFRFHNQCAWNDLESAGNDNLLKMSKEDLVKGMVGHTSGFMPRDIQA